MGSLIWRSRPLALFSPWAEVMNNLFDCHAMWGCLAISWLHVECWLDCLTFNTRKDLDASCHPNVTASLRIVSTIATNLVTTKECGRHFLQESTRIHVRWNLLKTLWSTGSRNSYHGFKQQLYTTSNFTYFLVWHLKNKSRFISVNKLPVYGTDDWDWSPDGGRSIFFVTSFKICWFGDKDAHYIS
jgi:hypothetical protein